MANFSLRDNILGGSTYALLNCFMFFSGLGNEHCLKLISELNLQVPSHRAHPANLHPAHVILTLKMSVIVLWLVSVTKSH